MHYLPNLRKIISARAKKAKPKRTRPQQPLDFYAEHSRASASSMAPEPPHRPDGGAEPPLPPLGELVANALYVELPDALSHWASEFPWRKACCCCSAAVLVAAVCVTALLVARYLDVEPPHCDEDCMRYIKEFRATMDWSVGPCDDFYRFVCGHAQNRSSVRQELNVNFMRAMLDYARRVRADT
ncbi:uncharacterized protein LOC144101625 [Amblyomma americanum]